MGGRAPGAPPPRSANVVFPYICSFLHLETPLLDNTRAFLFFFCLFLLEDFYYSELNYHKLWVCEVFCRANNRFSFIPAVPLSDAWFNLNATSKHVIFHITGNVPFYYPWTCWIYIFRIQMCEINVFQLRPSMMAQSVTGWWDLAINLGRVSPRKLFVWSNRLSSLWWSQANAMCHHGIQKPTDFIPDYLTNPILIQWLTWGQMFIHSQKQQMQILYTSRNTCVSLLRGWSKVRVL